MIISTKVLYLPAIIAGALLASSCSGSSTGGPTSLSPTPTTTGSSPSPTASPSGGSIDDEDPCGVLTTNEIARQVGGSVAAGTVTVGRLCTFRVSGSGKLGPGGAVSDLFSGYGSAGFNGAKGGLISSGTAVDVPGIGDDAIYTVATHALVLLKGETVLTISVIAVDGSTFAREDSAWRDAVVALARTAAAKI